jgi:3-hydroxyisobutyrate dehydrogenase-like beta-hydroxyacid dehydrogenase
MAATTVGLLHPGAMGVTIAASCRAPVLWCSTGRSPATAERAAGAGLEDAGSLSELVARSDVIMSVCPPEAAIAVADAVAAERFTGTYVDANAISPETARAIATRFDRFVDGGIIGPPAARPGTTRLYLAGDGAEDVLALWSGSVLDVRAVEGPAGAASALKMAYATWTKVSAALLLDVRALARVEGVELALMEEWALSQPGTAARSEATAASVAPKAWRFAGEMREIADTFAAAGLPGGFGTAAAELFERLAALKDADDVDLDRVLRQLLS